MSVMRSPSIVMTETGETVSVLAENFSGFQGPFTIYDTELTEQKGYLRVLRDNPDSAQEGLNGWGAGIRALFLESTREGKPAGQITPVLALLPASQNSKSNPLIATLIESAVDPVLTYSQTQKKYILYYWVNVWSPPPRDHVVVSSPTLFNNVRPQNPRFAEQDYLLSQSYAGPQPMPRFTAVRDVPDWYLPGTAPASTVDPDILKFTIPPLTTYSERVGPVDQSRFWVAPFTDAHLFRFPSEYDPFPPPAMQDPYVPPSPPSQPSPPPPSQEITPPSPVFVGNFPFLSYPVNNLTQQVNSILYKVKNEQTIKPSERSTLDTYVFALERIAGLARCSRVLMQAEGMVFIGRQRNDTDILVSSTTPVSNPVQDTLYVYLVVNHPRPVLVLPRGINKVLLGRPKMTSFFGANYFVTAALTYRYPAAATVSLCAGNPHIDFTIQCPSDHFSEYRRMGILPESATAQHPPYTPGEAITIPGAYGTSLIEVLSTMEYW